MNPASVSYSLVAANAALIVASNTPAGAGNLTLVSPVAVGLVRPNALGGAIVQYGGASFLSGIGAFQTTTTNTITLDAARRILVTYGNEAANRAVTITGGDRYGQPISEIVTVVSGAAGTAYTNQDFLTITNVSVGSAFTAAMSVGTTTVGSSPWVVIQRNVTPVNIGIGVVVVSGSVTYTIEYTYNDPNALPPGLAYATAWQYGPLASKSSTADNAIATPITAYRLTINSGTGVARMDSVQAGNHQ